MMNPKDTIITVDNLSKVYRLGVKETAHDNLAHTFYNLLKSPITNYKKYRSLYKFSDTELNKNEFQANGTEDILWALKDVTFNVQKGDLLGIIGKNGAGKSTLLKILCRITDPTIGYAKIHGRIASLLEVGTGFHPELTGRENVYLNGTILGMKKKEIDHKFDEIVAFSGVEKFIDTPVKRYSSGMSVRLAFSVAAHLEPEILIIDEVLAVGDAEFQKKCLNKMENVSQQGRTVLFVSHNMPAVSRLCNRSILLDKGTIIQDGLTEEVVKSYLTSESECSAFRHWENKESAPQGDAVILNSVKVHNGNGEPLQTINIRNNFYITMNYEVIKPDHIFIPHFHFINEEGTNAFVTLDKDEQWFERPRPAGYYSSTVLVDGNLLAEGIYYIHCNMLTVHPTKPQFSAPDSVSFHVFDDGKGNTARHDGYTNNLPGVVRPYLKWETKFGTDVFSS